MKQYAVFQHPTSGYEAVKNGWSWPAFFFTWIWAFVKRLWLVGLIVFLFGILASSIPEAWLVGELIISIVMGVKGNELRCQTTERFRIRTRGNRGGKDTRPRAQRCISLHRAVRTPSPRKASSGSSRRPAAFAAPSEKEHSRMTQFSIFQHPTLGYEAVKNGWGWPAFLFTWIWAFVKRLFLIGWLVLLLCDGLELDPGPGDLAGRQPDHFHCNGRERE